MLKKGQAAMEFLMTYGWAILVVLAAIGALAYFGVFSTGSLLPDRCTAAAGFSCVDLKVQEGDAASSEVRFAIINNLGDNIDAVNISLTSDQCTSSAIDVGALSNGANSGLLQFNCAEALNEGSRFQGEFSIQYTRGANTFTDRGEIRATARE